jgi:DNA modification methylase
MNKIHNIDWMKNELPDKSVQLIIADPPYFEVKGDFDFIWPSFDAYLQDVERWAQECKRVLADNGTLFWWGMDRKIAYAQIIFDKYFQLLSTLVWEKPSIANEWETRRTFPERGQERLLMYAQSDENDLWQKEATGWEKVKDAVECFSGIKKYLRDEREKSGLKSDWFVSVHNTSVSHYFAQTSQWAFPTEAAYKAFQKSGFFQRLYEDLRKEYEDLRKEYEDLRRPFNNYLQLTDVLKFSREHNASHPTQKPETLTRALILTCSRKNDLVLVPFAGSGTECAMAAKEGRRFIGYEINSKYCDMANKRCKQHLDALTLF